MWMRAPRPPPPQLRNGLGGGGPQGARRVMLKPREPGTVSAQYVWQSVLCVCLAVVCWPRRVAGSALRWRGGLSGCLGAQASKDSPPLPFVFAARRTVR